MNRVQGLGLSELTSHQPNSKYPQHGIRRIFANRGCAGVTTRESQIPSACNPTLTTNRLVKTYMPLPKPKMAPEDNLDKATFRVSCWSGGCNISE